VAAALFRRALDHLQQLDRDGKLEGRPVFKYRHMKVLKRELAYCSLGPRVLENPSVARSQAPYVTINLLRFRAKRLAHDGRDAELVKTVESLCAFEGGDWEEQNNLARALGTCVPYLDDVRSASLPAAIRSDLRRLCIDKAVAALARAIDSGLPDSSRLDIDGELASLRESPAFGPLPARAMAKKSPSEVRYPVR
jgi:hypothetical protein